MPAYYNEIDAYAAQWLRNLIAENLIAPGEVDERSIKDVRADDLRGFTQCHFFAGIGGWSYALRLAGWTDDRPVWTGSCPCQPFSAAGAGKAADDERHLWPAWFPLVRELRPAVVFGEQVEAAIGWGWLDAVFADLEGEGYACGATVLPACGVGAFHIRQRAWFVADADGRNASAEGLQRSGEHGQRAEDCGVGLAVGDTNSERLQGRTDESSIQEGRKVSERSLGLSGGVRDLANANGARRGSRRPSEAGSGRDSSLVEPAGLRAACDLANPASGGLGKLGDAPRPRSGGHADGGFIAGELGHANGIGENTEPRISAGQRIERARSSFWHTAEWITCTDGKARPVEPGTFPLAHGVQRRTSKLRAYGNAIVPQVAAEFIGAVMQCRP